MRERKKDFFRRTPTEWAHGKIIVDSVPDSKLHLEVVEGKELVEGIEVFVVFAVTALDLTVMPGSERFNAFVMNTKAIERYFKERFLVGALRVEAVCKLGAIVCLDALNSIRKAFHTMLNELRGRIRIMLFEGFQVTKTAVFINECVLVVIAAVLFSILNGITDQAGSGDVFHIDLNLLSGIVCFFVLFGNVLWIWQLNSHLERRRYCPSLRCPLTWRSTVRCKS